MKADARVGDLNMPEITPETLCRRRNKMHGCYASLNPGVGEIGVLSTSSRDSKPRGVLGHTIVVASGRSMRSQAGHEANSGQLDAVVIPPARWMVVRRGLMNLASSSKHAPTLWTRSTPQVS